MTPRNLATDSLKFILAVMVVGLHAGVFFETTPLANQLMVNGIFRIAVPTFFVINGYYLSGALNDAKGFRSWARVIALVYAFWMIVYSSFYFPFHEKSLLTALEKLQGTSYLAIITYGTCVDCYTPSGYYFSSERKVTRYSWSSL